MDSCIALTPGFVQCVLFFVWLGAIGGLVVGKKFLGSFAPFVTTFWFIIAIMVTVFFLHPVDPSQYNTCTNIIYFP